MFFLLTLSILLPHKGLENKIAYKSEANSMVTSQEVSLQYFQHLFIKQAQTSRISPIMYLVLKNVTNYKQQFIIYTELEAAKACSMQISKAFMRLQSHI